MAKDWKPGQHEELERLVRVLLDGQAKQQKALENLVKEVKECRKIDITLSIPNVDTILGIVKDIRKHQGGLSEAEEAKLATELNASSGTLKAAVESNQP